MRVFFGMDSTILGMSDSVVPAQGELTMSANWGLGILWVPPSHQPPIPKSVAFFSRLLRLLEGSSMKRGA
jgi:hypothetical protein